LQYQAHGLNSLIQAKNDDLSKKEEENEIMKNNHTKEMEIMWNNHTKELGNKA
jgi:hypothetical protein